MIRHNHRVNCLFMKSKAFVITSDISKESPIFGHREKYRIKTLHSKQPDRSLYSQLFFTLQPNTEIRNKLVIYHFFASKWAFR